MSILNQLNKANVESRNPPDDISPSELFAVFANSETPAAVMSYTHTDSVKLDLRFRILTTSELQTAHARAHEYCRNKFTRNEGGKKVPSVIDEESLADAKAHEILAIAITEPKPVTRKDGSLFYKPVFITSNDIYNTFTKNQVARLWDLYLTVQKKFEPSADVLYMRENFETWCSALADEPEKVENFLAALPWDVVMEISATLIQIHGKSLSQAEKSLESTILTKETLVQDILSSTMSVEDSVSKPSTIKHEEIKMVSREEAIEKAKSRKNRK